LCTPSSTHSRSASRTTARCSTSDLTARNLLEVVSVVREDGSEIVIHAMPMRAKYEPFLRGEGDSDA
jgi:hypothetical protein